MVYSACVKGVTLYAVYKNNIYLKIILLHSNTCFFICLRYNSVMGREVLYREMLGWILMIEIAGR